MILFLRKALIYFSFILGLFILVIPQLVLSAAIEKTEFTIDPFPLQPKASEPLFLDVIEISGFCPIASIGLTQLEIDTVNKKIKTSIVFTRFGGSCPAPHDFRVKVIDNLPSEGDYQVDVYDERLNQTSYFNDQNLLGSFTLSIAEKPSGKNDVNNIPTLSEWMLILMALILLTFAAYEIRGN